MLSLSRFFKEYKKQFILGPLCKLLETIFELIVPLVMASIIDVGIANGDKAYVYGRMALILLLGLLGLGFALVCQYSGSVASQGCGTKIAGALFQHISSLSYAEIDRLGSQSFLTRITNDVYQLQLGVAMFIRLATRSPFLIVGAAIMAMTLDFTLSLVFFLVIPLISFVLYVIVSRSVPLYRARQTKLDGVALIARENLSGARAVRAFSKQKAESERFERAGGEVADVSVRVGNLSALLSPSSFLILYAAILLILWLGGSRIYDGHMTRGEIIAFVGYMTQISLALVVFANLVVIFTRAGASITRINEVFDTKASILDGAVTDVPHGDSSEPFLSFEHVSFAYGDADKPALSDVSIDVRRGETIGVIGGTGSGKSTFVNLIPRFYDATSGTVRVAGIDVKDYELKTLRSLFGVVPQHAVLFEGSVADNLRWGNPDATDDEVRHAATLAQADEFIQSKPEGYDSYVSPGGKNYSGGQRQRLAIARALVGHSDVLILDDSSSALDYATEAKLRKALMEKGKGVTTFIVSQRTSSLQHADKILVLDDGRVEGLGSHEELLKTCRLYQEIVAVQTHS